jgi:hypothetical protein
MRRVAMPLLGLLIAGCAPATQVFDLAPHGVDAVPADGPAAVRIESTPATFVATFAGMWADLLVFDVEVVNHTDSTLVLDPAAFSYTLASRTIHLAKSLRRPVAALTPELAAAGIDRVLGAQERQHAVAAGFQGMFDLVEFVFDVFGRDYSGPGEREAQLDADLDHADAHSLANHAFDEWAIQQRTTEYDAKARMLHRTALPPGRAASGSLFLPGKVVRDALGPDEPGDPRSITAPVSQPANEFRLTLHAPAALGAQRIDYALRRVFSE